MDVLERVRLLPEGDYQAYSQPYSQTYNEAGVGRTVVDPLLCPTQLNIDDVDGVPRTANEKLLPTILAPPAVTFSVIANTDVVTVGAVTTKLNVRPPLPDTRVGDPEPEGP